MNKSLNSKPPNPNQRINKLLLRVSLIFGLCTLIFFAFSSFTNYTKDLIEKNPKTVENVIESKLQDLVLNLPFVEKKKEEKKYDKNRKPEVYLEPRRVRKRTQRFHTRRRKKEKEKVIPAKPVATFVGTYKCITLNGFTEVYDENGKFLKKFENKFQSYRELATLIEQIKIEQKMFAEE
ncbi:MAG: hypothetical protein DWQ06_05760 [Calditrichaeota bacterium]|nr:MAG: hypothetical protein DWQ06_05760 [Calditrichota bacterium]